MTAWSLVLRQQGPEIHLRCATIQIKVCINSQSPGTYVSKVRFGRLCDLKFGLPNEITIKMNRRGK